MPIFEYDCPAGHRTERLRKVAAADDAVACQCGQPATRVAISAPHIVPDGVYSYAPNVGNADAFERRLIAMRNGERVIPKDLPASESGN